MSEILGRPFNSLMLPEKNKGYSMNIALAKELLKKANISSNVVRVATSKQLKKTKLISIMEENFKEIGLKLETIEFEKNSPYYIRNDKVDMAMLSIMGDNYNAPWLFLSSKNNVYATQENVKGLVVTLKNLIQYNNMWIG